MKEGNDVKNIGVLEKKDLIIAEVIKSDNKEYGDL